MNELCRMIFLTQRNSDLTSLESRVSHSGAHELYNWCISTMTVLRCLLKSKISIHFKAVNQTTSFDCCSLCTVCRLSNTEKHRKTLCDVIPRRELSSPRALTQSRAVGCGESTQTVNEDHPNASYAVCVSRAFTSAPYLNPSGSSDSSCQCGQCQTNPHAQRSNAAFRSYWNDLYSDTKMTLLIVFPRSSSPLPVKCK